MTHEPECTFLNEPQFVSGVCWCCAGIRAAYRRGRKDAARAIEAMEPEFCHDCGLDAHLQFAAAVARGEGEQA